MAITDPTDLPGLLGWWDASDASTVTLSGSNVTQWRDKSGAGMHFAEPTVPPSRTVTLNGLLTISFNGSTHRLIRTAANMYGGTTLSVFAVINYHDGPRVMTTIQAGGTDWSDAAAAVIFGQEGGVFPASYRGGSQRSSANALYDDEWMTIGHIFTGSQSVMYRNNSGFTPVSVSGAFDMDQLTLGVNSGGNGEYGEFDIAELVMCSAALDSTERTDLEDYFLAKWFGVSPGVTGSAAVTLAGATSTATGTATPPTVTGTAAVTLAGATSAASGSSVTGTSATTNAAATSTASGTHSISGTAAVTLTGDTSTAAGTAHENITGASATTLADDTSNASGTATPPGVAGTATITLDDATAAGTGIHSITGTSAVTLGADTSNAVGAYLVTGTAAVTLPDATSTATGTANPPGTSGSAAVTLDDATSTATGTHTPPTVTGTAAVVLAGDVATATGSHIQPGTGTGTATLADDTSSASGAHGVAGDAAVTLPNAVGTATGTFVTLITGTATVTLGDDTSQAFETVHPFVRRGPLWLRFTTPEHDIAFTTPELDLIFTLED